MKKLRSKVKVLGALVFSLGLLFVGCGGEQESQAAAGGISFRQGALAVCLKARGAKFAHSAEELDFLSRAESEETAGLVGSTYDRVTRLFVDLWEDIDDPRQWLMWVAQPFDEDRSPFQIAELRRRGSYVAYAEELTQRKRLALKRCTR